ncbi:cortex morphogenetic protein CmpA [Mesobacillus persicus]|nr:cortex morphogenetic protein CmpA [Mesobacillus persicus]
MPVWFQNQMMRAFYQKDRYQIKLLNQCWYFYRKKQGDL